MHPSFPTRRAVGATLARALLAGGVGSGALATGLVATGAPAMGAPVAVTAATRGPAHRTRVLRVEDPASATGTRNTRVAYLEAAHLTDAAVPVVYFLHGLPGTAADLEVSGATTALFTAAVALGQPLVLVTPVGTPMRATARTDTEWGDDVQRQWRLETWLTTHLRTAVEGSARRAVRERVIAGFSMGGFGAAMVGLRHPGLYGSIGAIAGYFHLDDPDAVFGTDRYVRIRHRPDHLVFAHRSQRFLLADGSQDPLPLTRSETARFAAILRGRGYRPTVESPAGGHDLALVRAVMPALAHFVATR